MNNTKSGKTAEKQPESEEKYRRLFDSMGRGFLLVELTQDDDDGSVSSRCLDANTAFECLFHEKRQYIAFKDVCDVLPNSEPCLTEAIARVAVSGIQEHVEYHLRELGVWYEVYAYSPETRKVALIFTDITDRKRMEECARNLASFPQMNPNPVLGLDSSGRITFFNPAAVKTLECIGLPGEASLPVYIPSDLMSALDKWDKFTDVTLYREIAIKDRYFGETILLTPNFDVVRIYAYDITDQKKAEEALKASESVYRAIGESIDYGVWICAPDGRNTYASKSFLKMVGITQEQCSDFGWGNVLHPDDADRTIAAWKQCVIDRGTWDIEHRFLGVDGKWHPILARGVPVENEDGEITCWAGINLDISRMKETEKKLRESEERLRLALSAARLASWDWDIQTGTVIWNDELYRMMGYEPGEVLPSYRTWIDRVHPDDIASTEDKIRGCMAEGSDYMAEFRTLWPDGTIRWLEARGEFRYDSSGGLHRGYGVMIDRTEQKIAEDALRQAHAELAAANIELEAFNCTVSHDLRRPLSVIHGYCQLVLQLSRDKLDAQSMEYIREIYEGTLRMNRLIAALLNFSRINNVELRRKTVDLSAMAKEVAAEYKMVEPGRRVTFRIAEGISAVGDATLLRIVLDNIIGNAWKHSAKREETVIEFNATEANGKQVCFIQDNGPGFDMAIAGKLFVPFQRLPGTDVEGHGIGLATVQRIIHRHGGRIWAESEPGKGARFLFSLD